MATAATRRENKPSSMKPVKNRLDSDRPSHGRPFHSRPPAGHDKCNQDIRQHCFKDEALRRLYQRKANTAINRVNPKKKPPIKRGTHQREGSSILGWGFLAHPRMPCGYMRAHAPTIPKEIRPSGSIHFQGASTNAHNVARTIARTNLSATFIRESL